jgi:hypothetical protein
MSKKLYFLICFVSVLTLTSAGYSSELVGNFEQDLDGWEPQSSPPITLEMMTRSPKGATLSDYSLRLDVPEGAFIWAIRLPLHTDPSRVTNNNRVAFDVSWIGSEWEGSTWAKIDQLAFNGEGIGWVETKDLISGNNEYPGGIAGDVTERLVWDYSDIDFSALPAEPYEFYFAIPVNSDIGGPFYFDNIIFFDSAFANEPIPANTQTQVDLETNLAWTAGDTAVEHDIYFGTSFTEVNEADNSSTPGPAEIYRANQPAGYEDYTIPETLQIGKTYYWRVDENNSVELLKGEVWSFTTKIAEARLPYPADGAINVPHSVVLNWVPGVSVQDVNGHEVYFGTDFTEVDNADKLSTVYQGAPDVNYYDVSTIVEWAGTYFWRIDEVNEPTTWKGSVWSFTVTGAIASNPSPASPSADVSPFVVLTWTPGGEAASHEVYLSTDLSEVDDRDANVMTVESTNSHDPPGTLDFDTTYYWAVDEVNLAADVNTWFGDLWQFTTAPYLIVDNFNSYATDSALWNVWTDYYTPDNPSGAEIYLEIDPNFVIDGNSLIFDYHNTRRMSGNLYGSWTDANTVDLQVGSDWTVSGAKALRLQFYGDPCNSTTVNDKMYVALNDGDTNGVVYYPDVNDIKEQSWHQWQIDLEDFNSAGVVMTNVSMISIGFGAYGGGIEGGEGTVYFDEIEVWPPMCRPELVTGDFDSDCTVDGYDLEIMSADWLETDVNLLLPVSPPNAPVLWYKFEEAEDTIVKDQMGDFNGTVVNLGDDTWDITGGRDSNGCINLAAGSGTYVSIPPNSLDFAGTTNKITVAAWVNGDRDNPQSWGSLFCVRATGGDPPEDGDEVVEVHCPTPIPPDFGDGPLVEWRVAGSDFCQSDTLNLMDFAGRWNHYAFTKDADADTMSIYHNGQLVADVVDVNSALDPMFDTPVELFYIGARHIYWGYHIGRIDDFQVYDYDLSPEEVAYLATDGTGKLFIPLETPTNVYDVAPSIVNFNDFAVFAENWLKQKLWP